MFDIYEINCIPSLNKLFFNKSIQLNSIIYNSGLDEQK